MSTINHEFVVITATTVFDDEPTLPGFDRVARAADAEVTELMIADLTGVPSLVGDDALEDAIRGGLVL